MTSDRLDLVVFGASGFTGKYVIKELARICQAYPEITWGIAGRNRYKLETLLHNISKKTGKDLSLIKIIIADVYDKTSLKNMCSQAKVVVNCCGPFIKYGEAVVSAAVDCRTHYLDVGAEIKFIELLEQKYDQIARDSGTFVISTCGLVSIPADLGVLFLEKNFDGILNSVESYLIMYTPPKMTKEAKKNGIIRYSSWQSMINSMANISINNMVPKQTINMEPELKQRCFIHKYQDKWCLPLPWTDFYVISRTQRHLLAHNDKRPIQYESYITFLSIFDLIKIIFAGLFLIILSKISCTKNFLLRCPKLCSSGKVTYGDTEEGVMDDMCLQYEMIGRGWDRNTSIEKKPNKKVVAQISISGPDPPYVGTAVAVIFAAIAILKEKTKMPNTGGVLMPGVAFRNTSIVKNLQENNIRFQIINDNKE